MATITNRKPTMAHGLAVKLRQHASSAVQAITRYAKLERALAVVCIFIPAVLIWFDDGPIRNSISAYYSMEEDQIFYFFLTVASMLFVVNGVVKQKHLPTNTFLGVMLAGVILFNHDDFSTLHNIFAFAFFAGNAIVMAWFSSEKLWLRNGFVAGITLSMIGYFFFKWFALFWAEWVSFSLIAFHFILESFDTRLTDLPRALRSMRRAKTERASAQGPRVN